jgi:hypothetical protein
MSFVLATVVKLSCPKAGLINRHSQRGRKHRMGRNESIMVGLNLMNFSTSQR